MWETSFQPIILPLPFDFWKINIGCKHALNKLQSFTMFRAWIHPNIMSLFWLAVASSASVHHPYKTLYPVYIYVVHRSPTFSSCLSALHMLLICMSSLSASQLCEDLFEKINEDCNKEELSYSVEVSLRPIWHLLSPIFKHVPLTLVMNHSEPSPDSVSGNSQESVKLGWSFKEAGFS